MEEDKAVEVRGWMRPASSGLEDIYSQVWAGAEPKGVIQIAHGMAEHVGRYEEFAHFLAGQGYVVCMNEHAGHGVHAMTLGYFAEENGMDFVVSDMKSLMDEVVYDYPELPVFLMGHSMGSFLARKYITLYGVELTGCILSGTAGPNPALGVGKALAGLQKKIKGSKSEGKLLNRIAFGSYTKKIDNPVNSSAWLSTDDDVCIAYADDEFCGYNFTAAGFYDLFGLIGEVNEKDWAAKVPLELPLYLFSGAQDPVGGFGKGVIEVYEKLKQTGHEDLTIKLYPDGRHEMLNEVNREEVYKDVLDWLERLTPTESRTKN
ncbi:MAG: alpha/beta hydrolase [Clostridiales Family XIII bacterium]|jgi:alpha-beta hydrolase superfamily lysophospholipase|nr:alpha/beta hydrolase [Clostridiales Family XIII bacterium]